MTAGICREKTHRGRKQGSAIPGATTASVVSCLAAMAENEFMIPHTVPNSPTKGAVAPRWRETPVPLDALRLALDRDGHRLVDPFFDAGQKRFARRPPSNARRHSRIAEAKDRDHGMIDVLHVLLIQIVEGSSDQNDFSKSVGTAPEQSERDPLVEI